MTVWKVSPPRIAAFCVMACIIFLSTAPPASSLSFSPPATTTSRTKNACPPIKRVAIIGSGIAGLSFAHALENSPSLIKDSETPVEVTVFDSRPSLDLMAGAGVQLNGGMSVLHKINPTVQKAAAAAALPLNGIRSRARPWNAEAAVAFDELLSMELPDVARQMGGEAEKELIVDGESMFYVIMRGALQESLFEALPPKVRNRVKFGKCLTGIRASDSGEIEVAFQDGSAEGGFDMVVGCDGIKTAVKEYIETGMISSEPANREGKSAIYSGIRIRYAVQDGDASIQAPDRVELRQYFGEGAYCLSGIYGAGAKRPPSKAAFTIFLDKDYIGPFRKSDIAAIKTVSENADWTQDVRSPASNRERMIEQVEDCRIPPNDVGPVISNANRFFELGVYFHNPFSFGGWSKEVPESSGRYCVLCGDAAHAMPPFLGQGSNQAIQDAYLLAKKIHEHNTRATGTESDSTDLPAALKEYERVRWAATTNISAKAALLGYLEAANGFPAKFRDVFFRTMGIVGIARRVFLDAATPKI